MSLEDLRDHTAVQEAAISKLSGLDPKGDACARWILFRNHFWGAPLDTFIVDNEMVERDLENPIPEFVPTNIPYTCSVATISPMVPPPWNMESQKILVRSEYKEAEEAVVLSANRPNTEAFVVSGQPGIGMFHLPPLLAESNV